MRHPHQVILTLFIWLNFNYKYSTSFRFCYKGWQEVSSAMCPHGVVFENPVPMSCSYENNIEDSPSLWESVCMTSFKMDMTMKENSSDENILAHNLPDIQYIEYRSDTKSPLRESPDVVDLTECISTCSLDTGAYYTDDMDDPDEEADDIVVVANETAIQLRIKEQTLRLGDYMYDIMFNTTSNVELDFRIVDLLKRSFDVLRQACPSPYVPGEFLDRVHQGFLFLLQDSGTGTLHDIHDEEYQDIKDGLEECRDKSPLFQLDGTVCTSKATVEQILVTQNGKKEARQWKEGPNDVPENFYALDLFIDSTWRVIDVVHAVCFVHFKPNTNMHHRYQTAMEELFTPQIRTRWMNPTQLINNDAWGQWFLVNIESTLRNLFACQRGSYLNTPFNMKLDRPIDKHRFKRDLDRRMKTSRRKRSPQESQLTSIMSRYRQSGGIEAHLQSEMFCLKTKAEKAQVLKRIKSRCQ